MQGVTADLAVPERVLVVPAHPDDAEFGCGATVAKWTRSGARVAYLVVTDGSKGTWDPDVEPAELVLRRQAEQRKACEILGVEEVYFLRHPDGEADAATGLVREIAAWIRKLQPEVVLTHDPWKHYLLHPDHRATGKAVCDAIVVARDHGFGPELFTAGLAPHRPSELLLWEAEQPDHVETFDETALEAKLEALFAHASQLESTMRVESRTDPAVARFISKIRGWAEEAGAMVGAPLGESFKRVDPTR